MTRSTSPHVPSRQADGPVRRSFALSRRTVCSLAASAVWLSACGGDDDVGPAATVQTTEGPVRGVERSGVHQYLGIPYAAPPVADLRWRPPQAPAARAAALSADTVKPTCAQSVTLGVFAATSDAEDCLYANIYTPDPKSTPLPVMVWIHGGGNIDGAGSDYDGSQLAHDGRTVVVTFNYRLNIFGFLAHPALDAEGHAAGNYGLMDQQALLDWVRRNIAAFGGDPANVTVFGESAGGANTFAHLVSPGSTGLFHRAILESGAYPLSSAMPTLAAGEALGQAAATAAGCTDQTAACLRGLTVAQLLAVGGFGVGGIFVDGTVMPLSFDAALSSGQFNRVPIIDGANEDEYRFFIALAPFSTAVQDGTYAARVATQFGANGDAVLARYPEASYPSATVALATAIGDQLFICPARRFDTLASQYVSVYSYEFADRTAPSYAPLQAFDYGAAHTFEIPYLFAGFHGGSGTPQTLNAAQLQLSSTMVTYWTNFARNGDPNGSSVPAWPAFTASGAATQSLVLPAPVTITTRGTAHQCDLWDSFLAVS